MASAASSGKALFGAISSRASSASLRTSSSRIQRFSSRANNWPAQTPPQPKPSPSWHSSHKSTLRPTTHTHRNTLQRAFSTTPITQHGHIDPPRPGEERKITFIDKDGDSHTFEVSDGDNLLDIAQANDLEMEGACGGSCACSTCHVIVESDHFDAMEEPDDEENDMLDLAFGLTETSRLGCQVKMSKELDGLVVKLPNMTRNLQASDFK
ncbi:ferredoxin [Aaosphaeria arxii CBS 175.79]|uniref:Ferredoxin n=1 Tax=Aaosphaeria arxii CBS 175.79 TaxID=1450172 RepID=A0A6A5Y7T0_9PLEO|nr:ferredoxin [Aaosphaeria arxii CBS 175.79]KAF2021359.1 ferredoxin [Aaosphaeria arxii CBS 175.79]